MTGGGGGSAVATADGTNTGLSGNCNQIKEQGITDSKTFGYESVKETHFSTVKSVEMTQSAFQGHFGEILNQSKIIHPLSL